MTRARNITLIASVTCLLAACGDSTGGSNFTIGGGSEKKTGTVSFGVSDTPVDDAKQVVIEVDAITLKKAGESDVVIDRFTSEDLNLTDAETFTIDLLEYQGSDQAIVIEALEVFAGEYTELRLAILDEDINRSYVLDLDDNRKELKIPSNELKLGGFTVEADGVQTFTIEFNLRQAMTYTGSNDRYILKPRGVHILENSTAATLSGAVDSALFDTDPSCDDKVDPNTGNVVYLYSGHGLVVENLADVFDPDSSETSVPEDAIEPYAAKAPLQLGGGEWRYEFGFLPAGNYTLVFSCDAGEDDPEDYDAIVLPLPEEQLYELTLSPGVDATCNLPIENDACSR